MGDRANFGFRSNEGTEIIFLYGHWAGDGMMATLANALEVARRRWCDESYATRICISNIIGDEWTQETGWGVSTYMGDNEHSVPVVNWGTQTVSLYDSSVSLVPNFVNPKFTMGLDVFVAKFSKDLANA